MRFNPNRKPELLFSCQAVASSSWSASPSSAGWGQHTPRPISGPPGRILTGERLLRAPRGGSPPCAPLRRVDHCVLCVSAVCSTT